MGELRPILLVGYDPLVLETALAALADRGLANPIVVARSGADARRFLQGSETPALVLFDVESSDPEGEAALGELLGDAATPVLGVAAPGATGERPELVCLAKPLQAGALLEALDALGLSWAIVEPRDPPGLYRPAAAHRSPKAAN